MSIVSMAENGWLPDTVIRLGIRRLLAERLKRQRVKGRQESRSAESRFADQLRQSPMVIGAGRANEQHYEMPARFFDLVLGHRLKYSCGYWPREAMTLDESEDAMLELTCQRAQIEDGMDILELGCGWGSLSLWIAEHYPNSRLLCVSNSHSQRQHIQRESAKRGLRNVEVVTADITDFKTECKFHRVLSIEMFEHVRNYERVLERIAGWLNSDGKLFVHIFCHRSAAYAFEVDGKSEWMARHFFTGGIMPSANLLSHFQRDMLIGERWPVDGTHYSTTCEAWLRNIDNNYSHVLAVLRERYDAKEACIAVQRWRIFFMACAELFKYHSGTEWHVAHLLLHQRATDTSVPAYHSTMRNVHASTAMK